MIAQQVKHPRIVLVEDDEALQRHVAVALRRIVELMKYL
jgi:hypothetical protein